MTQKTTRKTAPALTENTLPPLPDGWEWVRLGDACTIVMGQSPPSSTYNAEKIGLPFFQGKAEFGDIHPAPVKWCSEPSRIAEPGDVLISVRAPVGPTNLCLEKSCIGRGLAALHLSEGNNKYLFYYLRLIEQDWESKATGTTFKAINKKTLHDQKIPLAPRPEQERIVAKIEALFSHLEAAQTMLARTQRNLTRYRASVLKAAVEGQLVPHGRDGSRRGGSQTRPYDETRPYTDAPDAQGESGAQLLQRILAERRARWEAQEWEKLVIKAKQKAAQARRKAQNQPARLSDIPEAEWQAIPEDEYQRHLPKNDKWKAKYKEPAPPDTANLPPLPPNWVWATVEQLTNIDRPCAYGVLQPGQHVPDGIRLVRVGDIKDGQINITEMKRIAPTIAQKYQRTFLQGGEVLISLVGAIGRTAVVPKILAGANTARAVGVIPLTDFVLPEWVDIWFRSPTKRVEMIGKAHEVARKTLNLEDVRAASVALPPLAEQERIVAEVERRLAAARRLEETVAANLRRLVRLRQAILKAAFAGEL